MTASTTQRMRGVSLIEALVAMAVMAFGMMAVVGLQSTLRSNADTSRQRAEAVRFGHERMEEIRTFSVLDTPVAPLTNRSFEGSITSSTLNSTSLTLSDYTSSTSYSGSISVTALPVVSGSPTTEQLYYETRMKSVSLVIDWLDRNNEAQSVHLLTLVSRSSPEIAGALSVAAVNSPASTINYRNPVIPPGAVNLQGEDRGRSIFNVPGTSTFWKFDNSTGLIIQSCTSIAGTVCTSLSATLLSGYVRYALGTSAPTSVESETPPDLGMPTGITVGVVVHTPSYPQVSPVICHVSPNTSDYGAYYCAVPRPTDQPYTWSGRSTVILNGCWNRSTHNDTTDPLDPNYAADIVSPIRCMSGNADLFASAISDPTANRYRICRYSTRRDQALVGSDTPPFTNVEHPLDYADVATSLANQNFLVIRAGNGSTPFGCPEDDSTTPLVGTTWHHQPPS